MPAALCTVVCCAAAGGNNLFVGAGQLFRPTINIDLGETYLQHNRTSISQQERKEQTHILFTVGLNKQH